jgi:hypothetical protein
VAAAVRCRRSISGPLPQSTCASSWPSLAAAGRENAPTHPDAEFEDDPEGRAAWDADPLGQFRHRFGTRAVDAMLNGTGTQVTTAYEMIACLPSEVSDGHAIWRILMKITSRTDPYNVHE